MTRQRYTLPAIAFHWVQAGLILWLLWLGFTMIELPKGAGRSAAYGLHKSLGLAALLIIAARLVWRSANPPPPQLGLGWEAKLATAAHHALYLCLIMAPLSGYLATSFTPYPLKFFGLAVAKFGWPDESLNSVFKQAHVFFVWTTMVLIGLHLAGVLKHLLQRDGTMQRMLPGRGVQ